MFNRLFQFYSQGSTTTRKVIVRLTPLLRTAIRPFIKTIVFDGITMHLDTNDNAVFRYLRYQGDYEKTCVDALKSTVANNKGCLFLDVGASYGFYSLALAGSDRGQNALAHIYAFEPDSRSIAALRRSVSANGWDTLISPLQVIAGDEDGKARLFLSNRASTSNRTFQSNGQALDVADSVELPCQRIDTALAGVDVTGKYIVMKIDVEGNEMRVLKGAAKTLAACKGYVILFEYYPVGMREVGQSRAEFSQFMRELRPEWAFAEVGGSASSGMHRLDGLGGMLSDMESCADQTGMAGAAVGQANNYLIGRGAAPPAV